MPLYILSFKAELENIGKLTFPESHEWILDFQSASSDEVRKGVRVTSSEEVEMPNTRATANVCLTFKDAMKSVASISVSSLKDVTRNHYLADDSGKFVPIVAFECRGAFPISWTPSGFYSADAFNSVVVSSGEWYDVDPVSCESVSISAVEWKIDRK